MEPEQSTLSRQIFLLGAMRVYRDGNLRPLSGEKSLSLLAYLALNPRLPHRREKLADLLFMDAPFDRVRRNFSDALYRLQKALGGDWLILESDTVALRVDEQLWVDVWQFERLAGGDLEADLHQAIDLYTGDLLPELYDDWLIAERELYRNQYLAALEKLAALQEARGDLRQALLTLRRLVSAEPLHEPAHQSYMRVLGRLQRYGEALAHYEYLRALLRSELDSEPLAETRQIALAIEQERHLGTLQAEVVERTPFVGRKEERLKVLAAVEEALKGQGGVLAIEGEAGIGKSRLLREIAEGIRWRGATLLQGMASQTPTASPFSPLAEALAPLIHGPRGVQLETLLADETLAALAPLNPAWSEKAVFYQAPTEQIANRFYNALHAFGETLAQLTPTVLAFDDLHWADPTLWKSLQALAQSLTRHGALLVVLYRRPDIEGTAGWDVIQDWDRLGLLKTISLHPLSVDEVAQLVGGKPVDEPDAIHAWTGGNPFYISEWLAAPGSEHPTRQNTTARRLQTLSPAAKSALESASILGETIPYQLWTEISALPPLALAGTSDELLAHNWLQPSTFGFAFTHDLIRDTVYRQIEPGQRERLHARAARAYQSFDAENLRALAYHLDRASLPGEAVEAYHRSGEQDAKRFAFREAQSAFERALALMPSALSEERIEIALDLVRMLSHTADHSRHAGLLEQTVEGARQLEDKSQLIAALMALGEHLSSLGQTDQAKLTLLEALDLADQSHDLDRQIEAHWFLGWHANQQGQWKEAQGYSVQALELARAKGDRVFEARAMRNVGIIAFRMAHAEEGVRWLEQAQQIQRDIGDRSGKSNTELSLLVAYSELGYWDQLLLTAEEVISTLDEMGDLVNAIIARHNLALGLYALGDYHTARQILDRAIRDCQDLQRRLQLGLSRNVLGLVAEDEGHLEEALELYHAALEDAEAIQAVGSAAYVQLDLGALLVKLEKPAEAIPLLEAADAFFDGQDNRLLATKCKIFLGSAWLALEDPHKAQAYAVSGLALFKSGVPSGEQLQTWFWALYCLLAALDQTNDSIDVLRAAYREVQQRARHISDQRLRRSFFENVPVNRQIIASYDQLNPQVRQVVVRLARREAPLGRQLRPDEYVTVEWTVNAPEDEAIPDKTSRRHYRIKRLLQQAESQAAAPTDEDLAQALGVSRRTILRDMQALAQDIPSPPTRKRKS